MARFKELAYSTMWVVILTAIMTGILLCVRGQ
jgi:preprotein translocase subunit SecE